MHSDKTAGATPVRPHHKQGRRAPKIVVIILKQKIKGQNAPSSTVKLAPKRHCDTTRIVKLQEAVSEWRCRWLVAAFA